MIEIDASRLLDSGERLIWSGKPNPFRYAIKKGTTTFLFGLFFFGFAIFWTYGAANQSGMFFASFGIPFLVVGLGLVLSPAWHYFRGERAMYALTDHRAVIDISDMFPKRVSVPLKQIKFVELKRSGTGFGDVLFREIVSSGGEGTSITRDGFFAIADVDSVDQLLRRAVEKESFPRISP